jgi:hypothetical protein
LKEKEEVNFLRVFSVFHGFNAGILFYDTLQSCPQDNFPPYGRVTILKEKEEVGFLRVFSVLNGFKTQEFRFAIHYKVVRKTISHLITESQF